jgi:hypothetical protein
MSGARLTLSLSAALVIVPSVRAQLTITSSTPPPYTAPSSITTSGTVTIPSGSTVTYRSGGVIDLKPGFTASAGSTFYAIVAPLVLSLTPTSGHGPSQVFTGTYSDSAGYQNIQNVQFLLNGSVSGANGCYVEWVASNNSFYLMNNAGTGWVGSVAAGSSATVQNSQCILNGATSTVSGSGNSLTVNFGITFLTPFDGLQNTYTLISGSAGNSGWQQTGTWEAEGMQPAPIPRAIPGASEFVPPAHTGAPRASRSIWFPET